jgi:TonB family protein
MMLLRYIGACFLTVVLAGTASLAQQTDSPGLTEARALTAKVIKLFTEKKFDEALPLAKQALSLSERAIGAEHPDLVPFLMNLGEIYRAKQKPGDARSYFERALAIAEKSFGPSDMRTAQLSDRLAFTAYDQRRPKDAARFFAQSLSIKEKILAADSVDLAPTLYNLAEAYRMQGEHEKAEPLYARLLPIREKAPGKDNVDLVQAVDGYSATLLALKKPAEAQALEERVQPLFASKGIVRGGVLNGRAVKLVRPEYPSAARMSYASGQVRVSIVIDQNGRVISAKAVNSEPIHLALIMAAEDAALRSLFTPTYLSGVAVKVSGVIIYNFVAQ